MNIKKRFLESSLYKVFTIIKKNLNAYFSTIILDLIFLGLIFSVGKYVGSLIPTDPQQLMNLFKTQATLLLFVFGYPLLYYLFVILLYSIVKLTILNIINSSYENDKFSLKRFGKFYLLNILIFIIFLSIGLIIFGISAITLTRVFLSYFVLILSVPFLFFFYSTISISHTLFIKKEEKGIIKKSFKIAFNKINKYGMFIVWDAIFAFVYLLFYNLIHLIFRIFVFSNQELLVSYGSLYLKIFNIISLIVIYKILAFNRIYFYGRIDNNVLQ